MKSGTTILELIIVIGVLAIVISIAVPKIKGMQQSAQITKVKAELQTLQAATESYASVNNGYYPVSPGYAYNMMESTLISSVPQIISSYMLDPFTSQQYYYAESSNQQYYSWVSLGFASSTGMAINNNGNVTIPFGAMCITNGSGC